MHQLGLTSVFFKDPSTENWATALEAGFRNIEICYRDSYHMAEMIAVGDLVWKNATAAGLTAATAHLPFLEPWDISSANVAVRKQAIAWDKELIDHISDHEIPLAVLHPSFEPIDPTERDHRMALAAEAIAILGPYAREKGVTLAVENLPRTCLGNCAEDMLLLTDHGRSASITFDVNHLLKETHRHYIETLAPYIVHMHMSDYDRVDEKHWLPGNGVIDWVELLSLLNGAGYRGDYLVEIRERTAVPGELTTTAAVSTRMREILKNA